MESNTQEMLPQIASERLGGLVEPHRWEKDDAETSAGTCVCMCVCVGGGGDVTHHRSKAHQYPHTHVHTRCPNDDRKKGSFLHNCDIHTHESAQWNRRTTCLTLSCSLFPQLLLLVLDVSAPAATTPQKEAPPWESQKELSTSSPGWVVASHDTQE